MSQFLHDNDDDAKPIAIPWVFPENRQVTKLENKTRNIFKNG